MKLYTFHHADGEMFGIGTMAEFAELQASGIIAADAVAETA